MSINITKPNKLIAVFLGIFLCIMGCLGVSALPEYYEDSASQSPVKTLVIRIEPSQREELFNQLKGFSEKHGFEFSITDYGGLGEHFLVYMLGEKVKILTLGISDDSKMFTTRFYAPSPGDPKPDKKYVDELVLDLKTFLYKIPNIEITESD